MQLLNNIFLAISFLITILFFTANTLSAGGDSCLLVEITSINPRIVLDIKYATTDNFTGQQIYKQPRCFALPHVAAALSKVQAELEKEGLGLKIFDAYRPMSAQRLMWNVLMKEYDGDEKRVSTFVSPPSRGGRHTRGTAVDLTIINKDGDELDMPTAFDSFDAKAHSKATKADGLTTLQIRNREKLATLMMQHGFNRHPSEWWHYDYRGWNAQRPDGSHVYPPRKETFEELVAGGEA